MTTELAQPPPATLPGFIKAFYVPYKDKKIGPYYVRCWKKNGKCHREYIKQEDLEKVRAACERNRQRRQSQIQANKELTTVCGNLNYLLRMIKRSIKGTLRPEDHNHLAILETQGPTAPGRPSLRNKTLPPRVGEVPRSGDGGVHHTTTNSTSPLANSALRAPNSELEKHFIAPSVTKLPATPSPSDRNTATPQYRNTDPEPQRSESAPMAQVPRPKAFPKWLTPNLITTLLAKLPQTPPTYSQTSLQQEECFRPTKPTQVVKLMLGRPENKEWKFLGRSQPDEKGIVYERYIAIDHDDRHPEPLEVEDEKPNATTTFKTMINRPLAELDDDLDTPHDPMPVHSIKPAEPLPSPDEIELTGPGYRLPHRRPIDLSTGEEVDD